MRSAKHLAWAYLIKNGFVYKEWSYYAGRYEVMPRKTSECLKELLLVGIDWDKTQEPKDDWEPEFTDTFNDAINVDVMYGTLILQNGSKYNWGCKFNKPTNVFEVMAEFFELDSIGNVAKKKLETWDETYL